MILLFVEVAFTVPLRFVVESIVNCPAPDTLPIVVLLFVNPVLIVTIPERSVGLPKVPIVAFPSIRVIPPPVFPMVLLFVDVMSTSPLKIVVPSKVF